MAGSGKAAARAGQSPIDALWRILYRAAFSVLLAWWWLRRPRQTSAMVALWHGDDLLLVHSSYRRGWTLPGGGLNRKETPRAAAVREAREEVGLELEPALLGDAIVIDEHFEHRQDRIHVFALRLAERPPLSIDHREIVAARFFGAAECSSNNALPIVRRYLRRRDPTGDAADL